MGCEEGCDAYVMQKKAGRSNFRNRQDAKLHDMGIWSRQYRVESCRAQWRMRVPTSKSDAKAELPRVPTVITTDETLPLEQRPVNKRRVKKSGRHAAAERPCALAHEAKMLGQTVADESAYDEGDFFNHDLLDARSSGLMSKGSRKKRSKTPESRENSPRRESNCYVAKYVSKRAKAQKIALHIAAEVADYEESKYDYEIAMLPLPVLRHKVPLRAPKLPIMKKAVVEPVSTACANEEEIYVPFDLFTEDPDAADFFVIEEFELVEAKSTEEELLGDWVLAGF